jgi:tyrosine-protein phosphatase YwqE
MLSKLFGSRKEKTLSVPSNTLVSPDWSFLQTDMHSHLIPGIDDGAPTVEDSVAMVQAFREMGFKSIVTTPHIKSDIYPNNAVTITNGLKELHHALKEQHIDFPVKAAAEYYVDDTFMEMLASGPLLTVNKNELLIEFSFVFEPVRLFETLFTIETKGYKPIIAHPERYTFFHNKPQLYQQLKDRGCLLQLNVIALTGYYGRVVKEVAEKLLAKGHYDYCGSDMHHMRHAETMMKLQQSKSFAMLQQYPFLNNQII